MLLKIIDGAGDSQSVIAQAQESVADRSGMIGATAVPQQLLTANSYRSGWILQNRGSNPLYVNELNTAGTGSSNFLVSPGSYFPPFGFPVRTGPVSIVGTAGDSFACREW